MVNSTQPGQHRQSIEHEKIEQGTKEKEIEAKEQPIIILQPIRRDADNPRSIFRPEMKEVSY